MATSQYLVSGGGRWPSVTMCTMAVTFKMIEQVEQQICIKFCIKLEHSSMEAIRMIQKIQKAAAIGRQLVIGSFIMMTCPLVHHF